MRRGRMTATTMPRAQIAMAPTAAHATVVSKVMERSAKMSMNAARAMTTAMTTMRRAQTQKDLSNAVARQVTLEMASAALISTSVLWGRTVVTAMQSAAIRMAATRAHARMAIAEMAFLAVAFLPRKHVPGLSLRMEAYASMILTASEAHTMQLPPVRIREHMCARIMRCSSYVATQIHFQGMFMVGTVITA